MNHDAVVPALRSLSAVALVTLIASCASSPPRKLKAWTHPSGDIFYELTGYCSSDDSCGDVANDECGAGIHVVPPSGNPAGVWLFRCMRGRPKSLR